ncbi:hypothetical protein ACVWZ6_002886 [Bradyrhizobium sp. GM6.1]
MACEGGSTGFSRRAPYLPAAQRTAEAIAANPEKFDRAIAAEIGVSHPTVAKARRSTGKQLPVEQRTGRHGKQRKAPTMSAAQVEAVDELDARDRAVVAYTAAKLQARLAKAKKAHDELICAAYRAQGDALNIEARAKRRPADEYDAAQARGEVARLGDNLPRVTTRNASKLTAAPASVSPAKNSTRRARSGTRKSATAARR